MHIADPAFEYQKFECYNISMYVPVLQISHKRQEMSLRLRFVWRGAMVSRICTLLAVAVLVVISITEASEDKYLQDRREMIRQIENSVELTRFYIDKSRLDDRVMIAMLNVPRHEFVPVKQRAYAYENRPLPIGHGQTISQPYIVALMTDLLEVTKESKILEVGTGSGYQAAVAAQLVKTVYTIEIVGPLATEADARFTWLNYENIINRTGDGYYGWSEHGPFDAIIVTAAASHVPPPLVRQLKPGGRMVIPVGSRFQTQQLLLVTKDDEGTIRTRQILPVRFVPLTGRH